MKIKQFALCTIARQKMGKMNPLDCIKFKEENWVYPFTGNYDDTNWIQEFYVEYFKKFKSGLCDNAFFTPEKYTQTVRSIFNYHFGINTKQPKILDAFCGTGNLTIGYYDDVDAFDINTEFMDICKYKVQKYNDGQKYNVFSHPAFNFDYNTRKFTINKLEKKYECIISNPPFGKYRGWVIDKAVIEFFSEHLEQDGKLIAILPTNFYEKYAKIIDEDFTFYQAYDEVDFEYTGMKARIFVFIKK